MRDKGVAFILWNKQESKYSLKCSRLGVFAINPAEIAPVHCCHGCMYCISACRVYDKLAVFVSNFYVQP